MNGIPERPSILIQVEPIAKAFAISIGVAYAIGYAIISIHHAIFGVAQFDPLRPKILLAGLIFILLTAIPGIAALRALGLAGLRAGMGILIPAQPEHRSHLQAAIGLAFYSICWLLARYSAFLFGGFADTKPWGTPLFLICIGLYGVLGVIMRKRFDRHPWMFVFLVFLASVGLFMVVLRYEDRRLFVMSLWYYAIGMATVMTHALVRDPEQRKQFEWERTIFTLGTILLLYAGLIYKNIVPYLGGGMPSAARMYFSAKTAFSDADSADVLLIEETHDGYYVLKPGKEKTAYFLRRDSVSLIHFGKSEEKAK